MANPFYIEPGGDITQGLQGLSQALMFRDQRLEKQQVEEKRQQDMEAAKEAYTSNDPDQIAQFNIEHPEFANEVKLSDMVQYKNAVTRQNMLDTAYEFLGDPTKENAIRLISSRKKLLNAQGVPPEEQKNTDSLLEQFEKDPEGVIQRAHIKLAAIDTDRYTKWKEATGKPEKKTTDIQEYEYAKSQGYPGSFLDYQAMGRDTTGSTTAIKEFEYAEKNPKFAAYQKAKEDNKQTQDLKDKSFKNASDLRKEFLKQSKDYQKVRDSYTRILGSTKEPSPAGDLSLIFNYMKMLDPGSVVRESEFATAASTGSYGARIQAAAQKVISGERLAPEMRKDFLDKAGVLFTGMQNQHKKRAKSYRGIAEKNDLPVNEVVVDITTPPEGEPQDQPQPTPGAQPAAPQYQEGQTATGPNGEKIIFRNGQWVSL